MRKINNLAILGPTGSGKTAVAHCLATEFQAEIVSCDSMQVYKGMDVGVAKPRPDELRMFKYHLIDMLDPDEAWNLDRFLVSARPLIKKLNQQNKPVILVGGSGLYAKALLYDYQLPAANSKLYQKIYNQAKNPQGRAELKKEIIAAGKGAGIPETLLNNPRRLSRAVEIIRIKGELPVRFRQIDKKGESPSFANFSQFIILPPPGELRYAINRRLEWMLKKGWIQETRNLLQTNWRQSPTAQQVLGYREVEAYLNGQIASMDELMKLIEKKTWHYARRQQTWFRHQHPGAYRLTLQPSINREKIVRAILSTLPARSHD